MAQTALSRDEALRLLREHMPVLVKRFGVSDLALFGSTARDEATADSDVDILVGSVSGPTSWGRHEVESYLEDLFGRPVDLVEKRLLRQEYRPWVEAESVDPLNPRPPMSEPVQPKRWDVYVQDMLTYCDELDLFTVGLEYEHYLADARTLRATSFNLEHIGEAAVKVPKQVRDAHPEIEWGKMIGLRNLIVHAYYKIEYDKLWEIIQNDIPELAKRLAPLLVEAQEEVRESGE